VYSQHPRRRKRIKRRGEKREVLEGLPSYLLEGEERKAVGKKKKRENIVSLPVKERKKKRRTDARLNLSVMRTKG